MEGGAWEAHRRERRLVMAAYGLVQAAAGGWGRAEKYFPGMPEGFPTRGDVRVMRALVRMTGMLHGYAERSWRCQGHRLRFRDHRQRIRDEMRRAIGRLKGVRDELGAVSG